MELQGRYTWFGLRAPRSGFTTVPDGGMCISIFVILRRGSQLLLGKMAEDGRWEQLNGMDMERVKRYSQGWVLPSSHLKFGENPEDAAHRVLREQLGISSYTLKFHSFKNYVSESSFYPGKAHWDICFIYEADARITVEKKPWFTELRFIEPTGLAEKDFSRGHWDIVEAVASTKRD